jgi:hypothetical protein
MKEHVQFSVDDNLNGKYFLGNETKNFFAVAKECCQKPNIKWKLDDGNDKLQVVATKLCAHPATAQPNRPLQIGGSVL